ncbi:MAG: hypothetical protein DLM61_18110 [Pseudonocardiales bacterium]|nr:MAG: hypothetical protein DLM61_18110 [Pseudonocardiales bacterium]
MLAAAVLVWLVGFVPGWCAGWTARARDSRAWHRGLVRQLAQTRTQLADALDQLDQALELDTTRTWAERVSPPPAPAVHVHVDAALPSWLASPALVNTPRLSNAMPVLPAEEVS